MKKLMVILFILLLQQCTDPLLRPQKALKPFISIRVWYIILQTNQENTFISFFNSVEFLIYCNNQWFIEIKFNSLSNFKF